MDSVYTMLDGIDAVFSFGIIPPPTVPSEIRFSASSTRSSEIRVDGSEASLYTPSISERKASFSALTASAIAQAASICVNVVGIKILVKTDWEYDRKEVSFQKVLEDLWIDFCDFTYVADVLAFGKFLFALEKTTVFTADTYSLNAERFYKRNKFFVYFGKNHLCDLHGVFVRYTETVYETGLHADFTDPAADLLATAVNDNRFESDQLQEDCVLDDVTFLILHQAWHFRHI